MENSNIRTTRINTAGIKKHFKKYEKNREQAIFELVANGFDAKATIVKVITEGVIGTNSVAVIDNGHGIDASQTDKHFSRFNDSQKVGDDDTQGAHGRGRLAFHLLCNNADWYSRFNGKDIKISIGAEDLEHFNLDSNLPVDSQKNDVVVHGQGTYVELYNFTHNLPAQEHLYSMLQKVFGWRLALNKNLKLFLNEQEIAVPQCTQKSVPIEIDNEMLQVSFFLWTDKPEGENSKFYLVHSNGRVLYRDNTSFNRKAGFYLSAYIQGDWVNRFDKHCTSLDFDGNELTPANPNSAVYNQLLKSVKQIGNELYVEFIRNQIDQKLEQYVQDGYFPKYANLNKNDAEWRLDNIKSVVREVWIADPQIFNNVKKKPLKIIISLLDKLLVSNENDTLLDLLESIIDLDKGKLERLTDVLKRTTLDNIISTIEVLQRREIVVDQIEHIMLNNYKDVLETPHLQKIIEANTWLFGEQHSLIGAEEDDFQKTATRLRVQVSKFEDLSQNDIDPEDIELGLDVEGVRRQVDLFLARKRKEYENGKPFYKCTIIEIKRPGVSLNKKHLRQLEDYADIIAAHPGFSHQNMRFELILVGRKISSTDNGITKAWDTSEIHNDSGLVFSQKSPVIKGYVKTWATIASDFRLSNDYLLDKLKNKRDCYDSVPTEELVSDLQQPSE
ncbi:putative DNA mismatch repair protein [Vibrio crassostreae]|uniref:ATP-binding protein n=1 Tax=Vibrio crassostreae TaxID=246167 RepID=UPI001B314B84|nr:ATP-binding protein [Vibrio crassostreae]CAK1944900.1 putative DNA mismatch repair protein [Vibrio crassostreae]CAK2740750.1 putative DNA mismatch repair protein [Vibrio crassostreae]CAK3543844.1 putative DNA mismatch repair protein [Vibrio crassostreae]